MTSRAFETHWSGTQVQNIQRFSFGLLLVGLMSAFALLMPLHALAADDATGDAVPQDLRDAIRDFVDGQDRDYAGLCREIEQWDHYGETCAFVFLIADGRTLVTYGVVATDELQQRFFTQENGAWAPEPEMSDPEPEPADPNDPEPGGPVDPNDVPQNLQEAIRDFLEQRGLSYAGLCTAIEQHEHYGKTCAFVIWIADGKAQVNYGLVASDEINEEIFFEDELGWHATSSGPIVPPTEEPVDPTPVPNEPEPGDGSDDDSNDDDDDRTALLTLGAVAFGIVAAGGIGAGVLKRRR
jgi:hypothetical protein